MVTKGDYELEIRVKNGRILRLMRVAGFRNVSALARASGVSPQDLGKLVNMRHPPISASTGDFRPAVYRVAIALGCSPDDMFSPRQLELTLRTNRAVIAMAEAELIASIESRDDARTPEELVQRHEETAQLSMAVVQLPARLQDVIERRFGLR